MGTPDRITLSEKAKTHLADLLAKHRTTAEDLGRFVANCALALDIEASEFAFDVDAAAFVRVLADAPELPIVDESETADWALLEDFEDATADRDYCGAV
jgi:hypothetical protein